MATTPTLHEITTLDLVELTEATESIPAGARGGVAGVARRQQSDGRDHLGAATERRHIGTNHLRFPDKAPLGRLMRRVIQYTDYHGPRGDYAVINGKFVPFD